ncbi:hypothetical protein QYE76_059670 [Lolium multiflorum]|uniref:Bidirectional sugar transporter SWEET n=1 Tax=Lolium multiflorum TaxID=4521 RepID=A0AAD8RZS0_LOLMU|nr:hypothetical protein QYE76_059670 [Lolium multiflorum]
MGMATRNIVGIVGDVTAGFILISPGITFRKVMKAKSVQERTCYPYLATLLNCICWVLYGIPHKNLIVVIINGIGILLEGIYSALYIAYSDGTRRMVAIILCIAELIFTGILVVLLLTVFRDGQHGDAREVTFGVLASLTGVLMYVSPVMDMVTVLRTKDKSTMSLLLAISSLANGVVWTVYAFFTPINWYIMVPNALGILCASAQIVVYAIASLKLCCFNQPQ